MSSTRASLEALFHPSRVAVLGASRFPGKVGHDVVANLVAGGFPGEVIAVNPAGARVAGQRCWPSLEASGRSVDLALVCVPAGAALDAVGCAIRAGARAIVVLSAGFREVGEEGAARERALTEACAEARVPLLGPNCAGLLDAHHRMNASFLGPLPRAGGLAVLSQSGAVCAAVLDWAQRARVGLGKVVSLGNKGGLDEADLLVELAADATTRAVALYLESFESGGRFLEAAETLAARKPLVVFKAGTTEAGARAAVSHTGRMAGSALAVGAALRRCGAVRADSFEEFLDRAAALALQPLPGGERVAVVTNAGGPGIMAADAAHRLGLRVGRLSPGTATALRQRLPAAAAVDNPVDVLGDADPERYAAAVRAAQEDEAVDAVVVLLTPQSMTRPTETASAVAGAVTREKPTLAAFLGWEQVGPAVEALLERGVPAYPSPERAIGALRALCDYAAWRRRPPRIVEALPVDRERAARAMEAPRREGRSQVGEREAKEILAAYGFAVPEGAFATSRESAVEAAERIGYPVAMKVVSPDVVHKSDVGGVRLDLADARAVGEAYDRMKARIAERAPEARLDGVLVERMCPPGLELILGIQRDPRFGPLVGFGLGGIFVEALGDVGFSLAPLAREDAIELIQASRARALLEGARGRAPVDLGPIARDLRRLGQLAVDFPEILELDVNPLVVRPDGPPVAVDARMVITDAQGSP